MVTRGFASCQFAGLSSFGIKFANSSDAMPAWSVHRLYLLISLQGFPTFVSRISPYRCARNFDIVKLKFSFYLAVLLNYYAYTYWFFDNIFHTVCKKIGHLLLGLSGKVFTFDRSDFSTIWQFLWLNGQSTVKIDAWALAQTVCAFIFVKE